MIAKLKAWLSASAGYGIFWVLFAVWFVLMYLGAQYLAIVYDCVSYQSATGASTHVIGSTCYVHEAGKITKK